MWPPLRASVRAPRHSVAGAVLTCAPRSDRQGGPQSLALQASSGPRVPQGGPPDTAQSSGHSCCSTGLVLSVQGPAAAGPARPTADTVLRPLGLLVDLIVRKVKRRREREVKKLTFSFLYIFLLKVILILSQSVVPSIMKTTLDVTVTVFKIP